MDECPRHFALVRHLARELSDEEERTLAAHLAGCQRCRRELQQIVDEQREYEEVQPAFSALWSQVRVRPAPPAKPSPARWPALLWKLGVPAMAACAVLIWGALRERPRSAVDYKGSVAVQIVVKRQAEQFVLDERRRLCPEDALRFVITSGPRESHLAVLSIDGQGAVSIFYPDPARGGGPPLRLSGAGRHELPGSVILDQTTGAERILVLWSPRTYDVDELAARLKALLRASPPGAVSAQAIGFPGELEVLSVVKGSCR